MGPEANVLHPAVRISSLLFWTVGSNKCLSSTEPSQFPLTAITCHMPGTAEAWITNRVIRCWVCCVLNFIQVHPAVWLQAEMSHTQTCRTGTRIRLWCAFIGRRRHFFSEWWWHRWHYWHKLHRVDWQYKPLIYCTCKISPITDPRCPEVSTKLRFPDYMTISTWRW